MDVMVRYDEEQRQLVLMALAHLAVERPGFDQALSKIAMKMDNLFEGKPELYGRFKELHSAMISLRPLEPGAPAGSLIR
jgi:hypothetical protein